MNRLDPFTWMVRAALWALAVGLLALLLASGRSTRLDHALYDLHMRHWRYVPGNDVVIVAIDPGSLETLGHWPWPRSVHARLIDRLTADGVRAIGMDIAVAEPDLERPQNDLALARAIARNGHVVMPVFAEAQDLGGMPVEILPIPAVAKAAAAIGQVDVGIDDDGVARGAYLMAGLGSPYWPSLALAMQRIAQAVDKTSPLPGLHDNLRDPRSPYLWERDNLIFLHYAGPAGSFGRLSYVDVLNGTVPASLLKGKQVLVGVTAEGMGDIIDTPDGAMPGVEYQANVLETLHRGLAILPLDITAQFLLGSVVLLLPLVLHGLPGLRRTWRTAAVSMLITLLLSVLLLRLAGIWWPPSACILLMLGGAALAWPLARLDALAHARRSRMPEATSGQGM